MKYYRLFQNMYLKGVWFLKAPYDSNSNKVDGFLFCDGKKAEINIELHTHLDSRFSNKTTDFTFAGGLDIPVISKRFINLVVPYIKDDIQLFPIKIKDIEEEFQIMNVISSLDCIDYQSSEVQIYDDMHELMYSSIKNLNKNMKKGDIISINKLIIDKNKAEGHHIFRIKDRAVFLIVSELIKDIVEKNNLTGMTFTEV